MGVRRSPTRRGNRRRSPITRSPPPPPPILACECPPACLSLGYAVMLAPECAACLWFASPHRLTRPRDEHALASCWAVTRRPGCAPCTSSSPCSASCSIHGHDSLPCVRVAAATHTRAARHTRRPRNTPRPPDVFPQATGLCNRLVFTRPTGLEYMGPVALPSSCQDLQHRMCSQRPQMFGQAIHRQDW